MNNTIELKLHVDTKTGTAQIQKLTRDMKKAATTASATSTVTAAAGTAGTAGMLGVASATGVFSKKISNVQKEMKKYITTTKKATYVTQNFWEMTVEGNAWAKRNITTTKKQTKAQQKLNSVLEKQKNTINSASSSWKKYSTTINTLGIAALVTSLLTLKKAINTSSDLEEVENKFQVVFKSNLQLAEKMSSTLSKSYAMSSREAKQYLSSVQDLLVPMGMLTNEATLLSDKVVKLAVDLGSFNNLPTSQVMSDIQSALVGNFETMKKYGVVLNETVVKQKALNLGLWDGKGMLNAATKAQVAFRIMTENSAAAIGDQERSMGSFANQTKLLKATLEDVSASVGKNVLTTATALTTAINKLARAYLELDDYMNKNYEETSAGWSKMLSVVDSVVEKINVFNTEKGKIKIAGIKEAIKDLKTLRKKLSEISTGTQKKSSYDAARSRMKQLTDKEPERLKTRRTEDDKRLAEEKQIATQIQAIRENANTTLFNSQHDEYENEIRSLGLKFKKEYDLFREHNINTTTLTRAFNSEITAIAKEEIARRKEIENKFQVEKLQIAGNAVGAELLLQDQKFEEIKARYVEHGEDITNLVAWNEEQKKAIKDSYREEEIALLQEAAQSYNELEKSKFDIEREQLDELMKKYRAAGVEKNKIEAIHAKKSKDIARRENDAKLLMYQKAAGGVADTFRMISEAGGKQSVLAFNMFKAFAIIEATIAANRAYVQAISDPTITSTAAKMLLAKTVLAMSMVKVGLIAAAQPPSYDTGGVSNAKGLYQTGNIQEAHVPIPSGKIPVELSGNSSSKEINIVNNISVESTGDTSKDQEQARMIAQAIDIKIKQSLIQEQRPGGLLHRRN